MADVKARLEQMLKDDHASNGGGVTNEQLKEVLGGAMQQVGVSPRSRSFLLLSVPFSCGLSQ